MKSRLRFKDFVIIFLALNSVGIGVSLLVRFNFGVDPISMFQLGISKQFDVTLGTASFIYNIIVLLLAIILNPSKLGIGTLFYAVSVGWFIDLHSTWIQVIPSTFGIIFYLLGQLILCLGYALMIYLDKGMTAIDSCIIHIKNRYMISYKKTRYIFDGLLCVLAFIMKVEFKLGLIFVYLTTGYFVELYLSIFKKNEIKK